MALEQRLQQIEKRLKPLPGGHKYEPEYIDLLDLPKETVTDALRVLWDATGGYQCILSSDWLTATSENELNSLNELTPNQLYEMMVTQRRDGT